MSVNLDNIQDPKLKGALQRTAGLYKRHKPEILAGMRTQAIAVKIDVLLGVDEEYQAEKKALIAEYGERLEKIKEKHINEYLKAGLL